MSAVTEPSEVGAMISHLKATEAHAIQSGAETDLEKVRNIGDVITTSTQTLFEVEANLTELKTLQEKLENIRDRNRQNLQQSAESHQTTIWQQQVNTLGSQYLSLLDKTYQQLEGRSARFQQLEAREGKIKEREEKIVSGRNTLKRKREELAGEEKRLNAKRQKLEADAQGVSAVTQKIRGAHTYRPWRRTFTHLEDFAFLREIDLSKVLNLKDHELRHLQRVTQLERLDLSESPLITGEGFKFFSPLINLRVLFLRKCRSLQNDRLKHLSTLTRLGEADFSFSQHIKDGFQYLSTDTLTTLLLQGCGKVDDSSLAHIACFVKLRNLNLQGCDRITDHGLQLCLLQLSNLHFLSVAGCKRVFSLSCLAAKTTLTSLNITGCSGIEANGFHLMSSLPNMTTLLAGYLPQVDDDFFEALTLCTQLERVKLSDSPSFPEQLLEQFTLLTTLDLSSVRRAPEGVFTSIASCIHLRDLNLSNSAVSDTAAKKMGKSLSVLTSLNLFRCDQLTPKGIRYFRYINLKQLQLGGYSAFSNNMVMQVGLLTTLTHLSIIDAPQVTDQGFQRVRNLTAMEHLNISRCPQLTGEMLQWLTHPNILNMSYCTGIQVAYLSPLSTLTSLKSLDMTACHNVSDDVMLIIAALPSLTYLGIGYCNAITDIGMRHLQPSADSLVCLRIDGCEHITDTAQGYFGSDVCQIYR